VRWCDLLLELDGLEPAEVDAWGEGTITEYEPPPVELEPEEPTRPVSVDLDALRASAGSVVVVVRDADHRRAR